VPYDLDAINATTLDTATDQAATIAKLRRIATLEVKAPPQRKLQPVNSVVWNGRTIRGLIGRVNNSPCLLHSEKSHFLAELGGRMWQNRSLLVERKAFMPNDTLPVSSVKHDCE
jgi:hypothetical protein